MHESTTLGMSVVLHVGMPKTGSTSFQMSLFENRSVLLAKYRLGYYPDPGSCNNSLIFSLADEIDEYDLENYLKNILLAGAEDGANNIIISAERLFMNNNVKNTINRIFNILKKYGVYLSVLIVMRDIEKYLDSYIRQLIYNGAVSSIVDKHLARWTLEQLQNWMQSGVAVLVTQLEPMTHSGNFVNSLLAELSYPDAQLNFHHANKTPSRQLAYAVIEGTLASLKGALNDWDVNAIKMDHYRTMWRQKYDDFWQESPNVFNDFSEYIEAEIADYIPESMRGVQKDLEQFYHDLRRQPVTFIEPSLPELELQATPLARARLRRLRNWANRIC